MSGFKLKALNCLDSYKLGHPYQYENGTEVVFSNFTPRSGRLLKIPAEYNDGLTVVYGLQGTLKELRALWHDTFFSQPKEKVLNEFRIRQAPFSGNTGPDLSHISALHDLGYLPIKVKALPEGSLSPIGVPHFTVVNTKPEHYWLTNALETYLSNESWKATTIATIARAYRRMLEDFSTQTGAPQEFVDWQGHCFADRGMSGMMDAAKNCAGHSTSFLGSDSVSTVDYIEWAYDGKNSPLISGSVPATEHSVMSISGNEAEIETFRRIIKDIYPTGVVSVVSDTWDFWNVITNTAAALKDVILARQPNEIGLAKTVFRPDSGDPVKIICGYRVFKVDNLNAQAYHDSDDADADAILYNGRYYERQINLDGYGHFDSFDLSHELTEPEVKGAVQCLWDTFGGTETKLGYKTLNERVGLIYGDSITLDRALAILRGLKAKGFSSANIVFGIGSYTYQYLTRDTMGFAMKATYGVVNGIGRDIYKDPVTDNGTKKSAVGLLRVEVENGRYVLHDRQTPAQEKLGELQTVFEDDKFLNLVTFDQIRARIRSGYPASVTKSQASLKAEIGEVSEVPMV